MFIETSLPRKRGDRARLESEVFAPTASGGRCMSFWYHMKGAHIGTLNVYMRVYGQSETKLWTMTVDQGDKWNAASVQIFSGNRYYQVRHCVDNVGLQSKRKLSEDLVYKCSGQSKANRRSEFIGCVNGQTLELTLCIPFRMATVRVSVNSE